MYVLIESNNGKLREEVAYGARKNSWMGGKLKCLVSSNI